MLSADGAGNTYELINSVMAPNYNVVKVPDCVHTSFGRHIDEVFDTDLNKNVFRFFAHASEDNDRCKTFDRQRTEIKSYDKSPDNLLGLEGERLIYKWKMKLSADFQVSPNFTHLHQIKSVGGSFASIPMFTLTARKATPDRLELRYTSTNDQNTMKTADLDLLRGNWVSISVDLTYGTNSDYEIEIRNIATNAVILYYQNSNLDNWQEGAEFARPKWGIYRSLNNVQDLKDEAVLFADFSIEETNPLSTNRFFTNKAFILSPNPVKNDIKIINTNLECDYVLVFNSLGKKVTEKKITTRQINISELNAGAYYFIFKNGSKMISKNKVIVK
ncbi:T9SS type A sorting domain-containing protein [Polaribacter sp.]|uniref:T9SS type A sorting domain-containing protein n=1 Tax=Polaribacter sp. TaxID=1920175 RepID=UPI0025F5AB07|nr:T9SS type A sorting domain-containing protein [Polaribacter sp.]